MTQTPTPRTDAEEGAIFAAFSEDRISAKQAIRAMAAESRRHEREAAARASRSAPAPDAVVGALTVMRDNARTATEKNMAEQALAALTGQAKKGESK